ncbi:MalY/PatB family protein [Reinekea marinisedimentorum]|uniref:cysteine-S-conjugate beta-lyase n=1 Tax=Reinekea marinisedimentorum TaxID=230495 RepID=A0A4R3I2I8_9GAMM|nr:PatB family C-S lyase [Reinekea marinisedimentorum]TCS40006.1 cystathionine beta-lyase [Reinekea marinisedimentorum]
MFDTVNRDNTHAIKWERYRDKNLLPMWVADMDIASPEAIQRAFIERMQHPIYGYTHPWPSLNQSVVDWCQSQYGWSIDASWIVWMPGVVPSFNLACMTYGKGGRVLIQTPNYPPLLAAPTNQGCTPVKIPTTWTDNQWQIDWQALEQEMAHPECHLFILCNPMNPNGAVLRADELAKISALCSEHNVLLCSDEIHCDLILDGTPHTPAGSVAGLEESSITLMAASKTFNIAGLGCSFAIIPGEDLRKQWQKRMLDLIPYPNFLGYIGAEVAFTECHQWHQKLLAHLKTNQQIMADALAPLEGIIYRPQSATFLAWIESGREDLSLDTHLINAGIMPSEGKFFGNAKNIRLNFGTGTETVIQAMEMLTDYWKKTF